MVSLSKMDVSINKSPWKNFKIYEYICKSVAYIVMWSMQILVMSCKSGLTAQGVSSMQAEVLSISTLCQDNLINTIDISS